MILVILKTIQSNENYSLNNYISDGYINQKTGEQTQFYQVISIEGNKLFYDAYTVLGDKYDSAIITKDFSTAAILGINFPILTSNYEII